MFEELEAAIEALVIPGDGDSIVAAIALRDRLDARIAEAVAAFDARALWGGGAEVSLVAWLRAHTRMTRRGAQRLRSVSSRLHSLPVCWQAYAEGMLSGGQIEAIAPCSTTRRWRSSPPRRRNSCPTSSRSPSPG